MVTYNTLLRACAPPRAWQSALQLWDQMRNHSIKPDIVSVRAWLAVMHAAGCWPAMLLVLLERLPRAVIKDPILQSKTCEALWSSGALPGRSAAGISLAIILLRRARTKRTECLHGSNCVHVHIGRCRRATHRQAVYVHSLAASCFG